MKMTRARFYQFFFVGLFFILFISLKLPHGRKDISSILYHQSDIAYFSSMNAFTALANYLH